jgi:hypothetical protein
VSDDELAAIVIAVQTAMQQPEETPTPEISAWKRAARLEAVDVR